MNSISWLDAAGLPASGTRLAARAPQVAVWALAAALGIQAAVIVTHLAGSGAAPAPHGPTTPVAVARRLDLTALNNAHLFGAAPAPPPVNDANAPPTNMPLILTGIVASTDPKSGLAIIGTTASNAKVYPVGERVPGSARVHAIYPDRVLLERNGTIEALLLPSKFSANGGGGPAVRSGASALDRVQRVIANEPGLISDVLRPQPVFADGKLRGYRVYPGRNARAFATLGLRNGDLVLAINGSALDDPARGNEIFSSMGSSDQARVTVMRNGQQQDITLNMSQIATQAEQIGASSADQNATGASEPTAAPQPEQTPGAPATVPGRPPAPRAP